MCGIVGILSFNSHGQVDRDVLARMRDTMAHRGPDGADSWISDDRKVGLGHRRLTIIDVSAAADQPMANEDGRVVITFNGEIYNHASLRPELVAAGHGSAPIIPTPKCWSMATRSGAWRGLRSASRAIMLSASGTSGTVSLSLARDRVGVKPLYFAFGPVMLAVCVRDQGHCWHSRFLAPTSIHMRFITTSPFSPRRRP